MSNMQSFLRKIEPLSSPQRNEVISRHAINLARVDRQDLDALIEFLLLPQEPAIEFYHQNIALQIAVATRDVATLLRLCDMPRPRIHQRALTKLAPLVTSSEKAADGLLARLPSISPKALTRLIFALRRANAREFAARAIPILEAQWSRARAAQLYPLVGTVSPLASRASLARFNPELALNLVEEDVARPGRRRLIFADAEVIPVAYVLLRRDHRKWANRILGVLEASATEGLGDAWILSRLALAEPARTIAVMANQRLSATAAPDLRQLTGGAMVAIAASTTSLYQDSNGWWSARPKHESTNSETGPHIPKQEDQSTSARIVFGKLVIDSPHELARLLAKIPPSERTAAWQGIHDEASMENRRLTPRLLSILPHQLRHEEARRIVTKARENEDWNTLSESAVHLPIAEAEAELRPLVFSADAETRGSAYRGLIAAVGASRNPAAMLQILEFLTRAKNEQEPVRAKILSGLVDLPASIWTDECAVPLATIVNDALEARDSSSASQHQISRLSAKLLITDQAMTLGLPLIRAIAEKSVHGRRQTFLPRLDRGTDLLSRKAIVARLVPIIDEEDAEGSAEMLFALAEVLGERVADHEELINRAVKLLCDRRLKLSPQYTDAAIELALRVPRLRNQNVRAIVKKFPSAIHHHHIWPYVSRTATDLLTKWALTTSELTYPMRYDRKQVPQDLRGSLGWTPAQIGHISSFLKSTMAERALNQATGLDALERSFELPTALELLVPAVTSSKVQIVEGALLALSKCDYPQASLSIMLNHLGTDRARIAAYAITRIVRALPRTISMAAIEKRLDDARSIKLTSGKALLIATIQSDIPWSVGERILGENPHSDVLDVALSVALSRLDLADSWALVERYLATSARAAASIRNIRPQGIEADQRHRLATQIERLIETTAEDIETNALTGATKSAELAARESAAIRATGLGQASRWVDDNPKLNTMVYAEITEMAGTQLWAVALRAATDMIWSKGETRGWTEAVTELISEDRLEPPAADSEPITRRARERIDALTEPDLSQSNGFVDFAEIDKLVQLLATAEDSGGRAVYLDNAVRLHVATIRFDDESLVARLQRLAILAGSRSSIIQSACKSMQQRARSFALPVERCAFVVRTMRENGTDAGRWLALALTSEWGSRFAWPSQLRSELELLRACEDPDVASVAARMRE